MCTVHKTPLIPMTPTGQPLDGDCSSSKSFPNFGQYAYRKNFKSVGQIVRELSQDRRKDMTITY